MMKSDYWWVLTPRAESSNRVYYVTTGRGSFDGYDVVNSRGVRPALYLTSSIKLSGNGTEMDPYKIV